MLAQAEPVHDVTVEQALYEITLLKKALADEKKKGERLKRNYWQMKRKRVKEERKNTKKRSQNYIHQILIKWAMLVTWVKCRVIFENGDKNVKMLFALHNKTHLC